MRRNEWMSSFYQYDWWEIENPPRDITEKGLYEWRIHPSDSKLMSISHNLKFELVETIVEFKTEVYPSELRFENLRIATSDDIKNIKVLTLNCHSNNPNFNNRFKNPKYFSDKQRDDYYTFSIENNFFDPKSITVVCEIEKQIVAFYILKQIENKIYKGIMTAVDSRFKGLGLHIKMQQFCFNLVGNPITTINTTQLHNFNIINNHIKEGRKLSDVKHIFYKKI
jgi:hypothetical protein